MDITAGGNAKLQFNTSGLTFFHETECKNRTNSTNIGQYCGSDDNCSTRSRTSEVSIETGYLIVYKVTYNRCFSAKTIPEEKTCYNVTVNSKYVTMSAFSGLSNNI